MGNKSNNNDIEIINPVININNKVEIIKKIETTDVGIDNNNLSSHRTKRSRNDNNIQNDVVKKIPSKDRIDFNLNRINETILNDSINDNSNHDINNSNNRINNDIRGNNDNKVEDHTVKDISSKSKKTVAKKLSDNDNTKVNENNNQEMVDITNPREKSDIKNIDDNTDNISIISKKEVSGKTKRSRNNNNNNPAIDNNDNSNDNQLSNKFSSNDGKVISTNNLDVELSNSPQRKRYKSNITKDVNIAEVPIKVTNKTVDNNKKTNKG